MMTPITNVVSKCQATMLKLSTWNTSKVDFNVSYIVQYCNTQLLSSYLYNNVLIIHFLKGKKLYYAVQISKHNYKHI
jgi:hypothetical protein